MNSTNAFIFPTNSYPDPHKVFLQEKKFVQFFFKPLCSKNMKISRKKWLKICFHYANLWMMGKNKPFLKISQTNNILSE